MSDAPLSLTSILRIPEAMELDEAIRMKAESGRLRTLGDPDVAMRYMRASVRGSYLFNRYVMPAFASHVFAALRQFPPVNDKLGALLSELMEMIRGELFTNNVFGHPGDCHAHFNDQFAAYEAAGGDIREFLDYFRLEEQGNPWSAAEMSPLWGEASRQVALSLLNLCEEPLATFIVVVANEEASPGIFSAALAHLPTDDRFVMFRTFLAKHVEFDQGDHGPVALRWLEAYLTQTKPAIGEIAWATCRVRDLYVPGRL
jgi:hypothetical protein